MLNAWGARLRVGFGVCFAVLALGTHARADQFIVTDVTYTHSKDTTSDSHYRVAPSAATPKDWTKPFDWTKGSVHVLLEVKTKPTATPTQFQVCFEGTPSYACTDKLAAYTKPDTYQWTTPIAKFYSPKNMPMQWANGVSKVALILKDTNDGKPQGDPKYVPTDLRVEVAVVSEGSTYQSPAAQVGDGGVADGGREKDASADSGRTNDASAGAQVADAGEADAASGGSGSNRPDAAAMTGTRDASATATADAGRPNKDGGGASEPSTAGSSGCSVGLGAGEGTWLTLVALGALRRRRRGNRRPGASRQSGS
jgi:hypothetical protein